MNTPRSSLTPSSARPWRVIAQELARETSRERILELSVELDKAFEEQTSNKAQVLDIHFREPGYFRTS